MKQSNIENYTTKAKELLKHKIITKEEYDQRIKDYTDYTNSEGKYARKYKRLGHNVMSQSFVVSWQ